MIESDDAGLAQTAYELELAVDGETCSTGRVDSTDQVLAAWPFPPLMSRQRASVRVRVWTTDGDSPWSPPLALEAALLEQADWVVPFVSPSTSAPQEVRPGYLLRAEFTVPDGVVSARLYATAHGLYTVALNGARVGDEELVPGWTTYRYRLRSQTHDVGMHLRPGSNVLTAQLADGWYRGRIGFRGGLWDVYGSDVAFLAQLEVRGADGSREVVRLDEAWRCSVGPVVAAGLYEGETYDARREPEGWMSPGFDDAGWSPPTLLPREDFTGRLEPAIGDPVRVVQELPPVSVELRANGRIRLDFGQNIAGRLAIRVRGPRGQVVRLHHAEALESDELAIRPLREAPSIDSYTLHGEGEEEWSPAFTIHGFRYAELEGWPGELGNGDVRALVIHSDMTRRGWFDTGHELLAKLHENTVWSMRGNFVDLPTDCPQRDERLGWTGDIQVFAPAASFLYDCGGVLASWMEDVAAEQGRDGGVPNFVPFLNLGFHEDPVAAWGDAIVIVPWTLYQRTGDRGILERHAEGMSRWVGHCAGRRDRDGLIRTGIQLGDWLDPSAPPDDPAAGVTDRYLVANAYLIHSARIVSQVAALLGDAVEARRLRALADATTDAFRAVYVREDGLVGESATALSLVIGFELLADEAATRAAGTRLATLVREGGYRVQTGFVGTPLVCDALASTGHVDDAYRLLTETACPSWLYPVTMGATTIWERWDSKLPDGTVNPGEMTSFNHYALGAVVDFLHRGVAGLAPAAPGYRRLRIQPRPSALLGSASAELDTPYGRASSSWTLRGDVAELEVVVPVSVTATVVLPDGEHEVGSGVHRFSFDGPTRNEAVTW